MKRPFDSDTQALEQRIQANRGTRHDLDAWIVAHLRLGPGRQVLDIGCGTGKQLFALGPLLLPGGSVTGVDISPEAVAAVSRRAAEEGAANVSAQCLPMDEVPRQFRGRRFDAIVSTYALYYSRDLVALMRELRGLLGEGGELFVCGYGRGTNAQVVDALAGLAGPGAPPTPPVDDFISAEQVDALRSTYAAVETDRLDNAVRFDSAEALLGWWRNHNSHVPALDARFAEYLERHFREHGEFVLSKQVLGVHCHVS